MRLSAYDDDEKICIHGTRQWKVLRMTCRCLGEPWKLSYRRSMASLSLSLCRTCPRSLQLRYISLALHCFELLLALLLPRLMCGHSHCAISVPFTQHSLSTAQPANPTFNMESVSDNFSPVLVVLSVYCLFLLLPNMPDVEPHQAQSVNNPPHDEEAAVESATTSSACVESGGVVSMFLLHLFQKHTETSSGREQLTTTGRSGGRESSHVLGPRRTQGRREHVLVHLLGTPTEQNPGRGQPITR